MDTDDLENLINDSLGGVTSALEADKRAAAPAPSAERNSGDAVRELQAGPPAGGEDADGDDQLFGKLVNDLQDEGFQQMMADVLRGADGNAAAGAAATEQSGETPACNGAGASSGAGASGSSAGVDDFLQQFAQSFDSAVGSDGQFEQQLATMMSSMLSKEMICEPFEKIVEELGPWLQQKAGKLPESDRARHESQLRLYKEVLRVCKSSPDPLPEAAREEIQRFLQELPSLGELPDEVMARIQPPGAGGGDEDFEDFIQKMGLAGELGQSEQDMLKKLAADPNELTKVMADMADSVSQEDCKQQ